jgi:hypothetical protein
MLPSSIFPNYYPVPHSTKARKHCLLAGIKIKFSCCWFRLNFTVKDKGHRSHRTSVPESAAPGQLTFRLELYWTCTCTNNTVDSTSIFSYVKCAHTQTHGTHYVTHRSIARLDDTVTAIVIIMIGGRVLWHMRSMRWANCTLQRESGPSSNISRGWFFQRWNLALWSMRSSFLFTLPRHWILSLKVANA